MPVDNITVAREITAHDQSPCTVNMPRSPYEKGELKVHSSMDGGSSVDYVCAMFGPS
jgi:hypothetical protein